LVLVSVGNYFNLFYYCAENSFYNGPVGQDFGTVHLPNTQYVMKGHFIIEQSTETPLTYLLASLFCARGARAGVRAFGVFCVLVNGLAFYIGDHSF